MKYILLIAFMVPAFLMSQDINKKDAQGRKQGKWVETWPKSTIKKYEGTFKDDKPVGTFTFWYEGGKPRAIMKYRADGKTTDVQFYHEHGGEIMGQGKYVDKKKDSTWVFYDQRGRLSYIENYKNGKLHGEKTIFYVDANVSNTGVKFKEGVVMQKSQYRDGLLHGDFEQFYTTGKKKMKGKYVDGNKEGSFTYYYSNGRLEKSEHYKYSVLHGAVVLFDKNGVEKGKVYYREGRLMEGKELDAFLYELNNQKK